MYILKGFYTYPELIDNQIDEVAVLGEISDDSLTYAKNKSILTSESTPHTGFISFHSVMNENPVEVPSTFQGVVMDLGEYIYNRAVDGTITNNPDALRQMVMAEFGTVISSFSSGVMINNDFIWMPEYIRFTAINAEENEITIWLADNSFAAQYDEYFIDIIHPIIPYDDFFKDPLVVKQLLDSYNLPEKLDEVQVIRGKYPFTVQRGFQFDYVNPANPAIRWPAYWIAIIYGVAGNNPDLIKDKIVEDLLNNSNHSREEWEQILPDLFLTTEFILTPFWDQYAIEQADFLAGIHSPTVNPRANGKLPLIRRTARGPGYTEVYVDNNFETSAHMYKSLAFSAVGNPQNRGGIRLFSQKFPDYILADAEAGGDAINRVSPETVEWMQLFARLLKAAETMTRFTSVPTGLSRMVRDNIVYASAYYKNVNYMVVTKGSVLDNV